MSLAAEDLVRARRFTLAALKQAPDNLAAIELRGDLAAKSGDAKAAVADYTHVIRSSSTVSETTYDKLGAQYMLSGQPFESLAVLRLLVKTYPENPEFRGKLVGLLAALGLEYEAAPHARWLGKNGHSSTNILTLLSELSRPQTNSEVCKHALASHKTDLRPHYGLARLDAHAGRWPLVKQRLQPVVKQHRDFLPAQALYIRSLVATNDAKEIERWSKQVPEGINSQISFWVAAGLWAEQLGDTDQAINAFANAAQLDQDHHEAVTHLSRSLAISGKTKDAAVVAKRAEALGEYRKSLDKLLSWKTDSQAATVAMSEDLEALGRRWESVLWMHQATIMKQQLDKSLQPRFEKAVKAMRPDVPWQMPTELSKLAIANSRTYQWRFSPTTPETDHRPQAHLAARFEESAVAWELRHGCPLGAKKESGFAIYETGAGGASVLDFDLNGTPDLYLTKCDGAPIKRDSSPNHLYRNLETKFQRVTDHAAAGDVGFAQGVAAGDYNADGFPDLLICNIGENRLLRNNGDGTFKDVSDTVNLPGSVWTTSAAIADLNNDGIADFYFTGYCAGQEPFTQACDHHGVARSCTPISFDAQPDQVLMGQPDGTFVDKSDDWLTEHSIGYGFGVVVGSLDQTSGLDVFVANDGTANHYWSALPSGEGDGFQLGESAIVRGLAFSKRSVPQASMGIAADDADQDGDVDFFLTHFTDDYHTLYEQVRPGIWSDRSNSLGFATPTDSMLGFGTQWLDVNNDGVSELLVGNGHIDDFGSKTSAFQMPTQLFSQTASGQWQANVAKDLGEFFSDRHLARSIARLDVNADGKNDAVITRLSDPVALLINQTKTASQSIRICLSGTTSDRNAIGTRVQYNLDGQKRSAQLFGGDGFQCTNERVITIGVGDTSRIDDVSVIWPDGNSESLQPMEAGGRYLVVQDLGVFRYDSP